MNRAARHFRLVYEEHGWRVYGFFGYRLGDEALAEDLTRMTLERALREWGRFDRRQGSEQTWLLAIAREVAGTEVAGSEVAGTELAGSEVAGTEVAGTERSGSADPGPVGRPNGTGDLTGALSRLADPDREVVALRFGADLTSVELASLLGLSVENVEQILSHALRQLGPLLGPERAARNLTV